MQQHFFQARKPKKKTNLSVYMTIWSMGPRVLKKSIITMLIKCWIIFLTMKNMKRRSLGGTSHLDAKKMGFAKNRYVMKMLKTQGSKETLIEPYKGR